MTECVYKNALQLSNLEGIRVHIIKLIGSVNTIVTQRHTIPVYIH